MKPQKFKQINLRLEEITEICSKKSIPAMELVKIQDHLQWIYQAIGNERLILERNFTKSIYNQVN